MSAKIELKHLAADNNIDFIKAEHESLEEINVIHISGFTNGNEFSLILDKSTSIRFAKTLRTEINKIQD